MATELPRCYNRPAFKDTIRVQKGYFKENGPFNGARKMVQIPDPMSKGCQQHGPMGEAHLHPEDWNCVGCKWKPGAMQ